MSTPFLGEIKIFAGNYAIRGWAFCNGQIMSISQNAALFSLLGTTYGGNGTSTFALPNLMDRAPMAWGAGPGLAVYVLGQTGGAATHALTGGEAPIHNHPAQAVSGAGQSSVPTGNLWAAARAGRGNVQMYSDVVASPTPISSAALLATGGGLPHNNLAPVETLNFIIAMQGIFPSRN
jgi:microcystin-dependent protein